MAQRSIQLTWLDTNDLLVNVQRSNRVLRRHDDIN